MRVAAIATILSFTLFGVATVLAAPSETASPTADAVLEKYVNAVGGKEAWEKVESRHVKADVEVFGSTAEWSLEAKAPNKRATRVDLPGIGLIQDGFDGTTAWAKTPEGVRTKEGDELARAKVEAELRREVRLKEIYPALASKGAEVVNGEEVQTLEAKPSATSKERFSFSAKTGLLVRQQSDFKGNDGNDVTVESDFSDYRDVEGIKYPHAQKVKVFAGGQQLFEFALKLKEIKHNQKVDDAQFKRPE